MSRSGYSDDCEGWDLFKWRGQVHSSLHSKRGQAFMKELLAELDAMPIKELIAEELIDDQGRCCTIGAICKSRGVDVSKINYYEPSQVAEAVGIGRPLAAEIEFINDEEGHYGETPAERWTRMRKWVAENIWDWKEVD